jgi:hypothetical protein
LFDRFTFIPHPTPPPYQTLWFLYDEYGLGFVAEEPIFRDHIIVHATGFQQIELQDTVAKQDAVQFYRVYIYFLSLITKQFTMIRSMLVGTSSRGMDAIIYNRGNYYRVKTVKPYVNYCYYPMYLPPAVASTANEVHSNLKACALSETTVESSADRAAAEHLSLAGGMKVFLRYLYAVHFRRCVLLSLAVTSMVFVVLLTRKRAPAVKPKEA